MPIDCNILNWNKENENNHQNEFKSKSFNVFRNIDNALFESNSYISKQNIINNLINLEENFVNLAFSNQRKLTKIKGSITVRKVF